METTVHRLIEQRVAQSGDSVALVQDDRAISYRELNHRANTLARRLMSSGFRRQAHAIVAMEHSIELAVTLFAVLKAGGAYTWMSPRDLTSTLPSGAYPPFSFTHKHEGGVENRYLALNLRPLLAEDDRPASNLPVLTRAHELACLLPNEQGQLANPVPHDSIVALIQRNDRVVEWRGDPAALDLWGGLMRGATVSVVAAAAEPAPLQTAA